jgi:hypothetical protein
MPANTKKTRARLGQKKLARKSKKKKIDRRQF